MIQKFKTKDRMNLLSGQSDMVKCHVGHLPTEGFDSPVESVSKEGCLLL